MLCLLPRPTFFAMPVPLTRTYARQGAASFEKSSASAVGNVSTGRPGQLPGQAPVYRRPPVEHFSAQLLNRIGTRSSPRRPRASGFCRVLRWASFTRARPGGRRWSRTVATGKVSAWWDRCRCISNGHSPLRAASNGSKEHLKTCGVDFEDADERRRGRSPAPPSSGMAEMRRNLPSWAMNAAAKLAVAVTRMR